MFADDANLFISDSNIENLFETMNEELRKVANWFKANKLSLNISKTKYSLFHSTRKRKDIPNILPPLHIDNVPVKREFVTKFLGVYLDENISWKHHINIVSTKVCKIIARLYRTRCILSKFLRKQLLIFFYKLLLKLCKYSMGQYKQMQITSSLSLSETCSKDNNFQRQIHFCRATT